MEGLSGALQLKGGGRSVERGRARRQAASEQLPEAKQADQAGEHHGRAAAPAGAHGERGAGLEGADFWASDWPPDASDPVVPLAVAVVEPARRGSRRFNTGLLVVAELLHDGN